MSSPQHLPPQPSARHLRLYNQNLLSHLLSQHQLLSSQLQILKSLTRNLTPALIPPKFFLNIGAIFTKQKSANGNYYKTIEREIGERVGRKKELKEEIGRVIERIVGGMGKEEYGLLRVETVRAVEEYQEELEDMMELRD